MVAIHGLATRHKVDLDALLRDRFHVCGLFEISAAEASELIGQLQATNTPSGGNINAGGG